MVLVLGLLCGVLPAQGLARRVVMARTPAAKADAAMALAALSRAAYGEWHDEGWRVVAPDGWRVAEVVKDARTGFAASLFEAEPGGEAVRVLAFAGTDVDIVSVIVTAYFLVQGEIVLPKDLETDLELSLWQKPKQFEQARELVTRTRAKAAKDGFELVCTGHSLGGALAIYAGMTERVSAVVYNAPALNPRLYADVPYANRASFKDGPWWLALQSSTPEGQESWASFDADLVSGWLSDVYAGKLAELLDGDNVPVVEAVRVPTGCNLDRMCHKLDAFPGAGDPSKLKDK
jgi:hypothetical protein